MYSRIDPLSWNILIDEPMPAHDMRELWDNPSRYTEMKKIIHESVHFWHSISTHQGIALAFDCLKSFNVMRAASRNGENLAAVGKDWDFNGFRPFEMLRNWQTAVTESESKLSIYQIFEGLARYWDVVICSGPTTSDLVKTLIQRENETYSEAYRFSHDVIGNDAFIMFPIFAYLALCAEEPVQVFEANLHSFCNHPFAIPRGDFQFAWRHAWAFTASWAHRYGTSYGPMSTYKHLHKQYVNWKLMHATGIKDDFALTGHPILEEYIQGMMMVARLKWPGRSDYDLEPQFLEEFVFPGNPGFRQLLLSYFLPPSIHFKDGQSWGMPTPLFREKPEKFMKSMNHFSWLMGACINLSQYSKGIKSRHGCKQSSCSAFDLGLCTFVDRYPDSVEACEFKPLLKYELGIG